MATPNSKNQESKPSRPGSELSQAFDELHTVAALLAGALAIAEAGSPVERSLRITSEALEGVIESVSDLV